MHSIIIGFPNGFTVSTPKQIQTFKSFLGCLAEETGFQVTMDLFEGVRLPVFLIFITVILSVVAGGYTLDELGIWEELSEPEPLETLTESEMSALIKSKSHFTKQNPAMSSSSMFGFTAVCTEPPNFPPTIPLIPGVFSNWAENIHISHMWIAIPRTYRDVLMLANWAYLNEFMLRPKGYSKSWAPLTATKTSSCENTVLVDTTQFLIQMKMLSSKGKFRALQVQTGASMEDILSFLEDHKCGLFAAPVLGEISIGGVLAVSGHGSGLPTIYSSGATYEDFSSPSSSSIPRRAPAGYSAGSLSNLILSFKAVVWDEDMDSYVIKKFVRAERDSRAFLTHMGRAFLTEVTLVVGPAYKLRCQSLSDLSAEKLLAHPDEMEIRGGTPDHETFSSLVEKYQSVDLSIFPYTDGKAVLLVCNNRSKNHRDMSREVTTPYPFTYLENVPRPVTALLSQIMAGRHYLAPMLSRLNHQFNSVGLRLSNNEDIWGPSKNILVRYKSSMTHSFSSGYAIITSRENLQKVASEVYSLYSDLLTKFSSDWQYPQNEPFQLTVTGLDDPKDLPPFGKFEPPALSILAPVKGKNFDMALFLSINVHPGTKHFEKFMREMESLLFLRYDGEEAVVRPEWAKAWAFTDAGAWDNHILMRKVIPKAYGNDWNWAVQKLNQYDPHHIFSNDFLRYFLQLNGTMPASSLSKLW